MMKHQILFALFMAISICFSTSYTFAKEESRPSKHRKIDRQNAAREGIINRIDLENGTLIINDLIFAYSPRLVVHKYGAPSDISALQANQKIRYRNASRNRMLSEIWIVKK